MVKVSELTSATVAAFCRVDEDATDIQLIDTLFLPAAKQYVKSHTGMKDEEMDLHADIPIAICALCCHMYDNRSVEVTSDKVNQVVMDIIGRYDRNLIPQEVAAQ